MHQVSSRFSSSLRHSILILPFVALVVAQGCQSDPSIPSGDDPVLIPHDERRLDLDDDGAADFLFSYQGMQTADVPPSVVSWTLNADAFDDHQVQYSNGIGTIPLMDGTTISAASGWIAYDAPLATRGWERERGWAPSWVGIWIDVGPRSLGLRLKKPDGWHYGWVKMTVDAHSGKLNVLDFAYQRQPNRSIQAGYHP